MIILYSILGILVVVIAILALNTWMKKPTKAAEPKDIQIEIDAQRAAKNLSGMIRFKTVSSYEEDTPNADVFQALHQYLEQTYPLIHKTLEKEVINRCSLLYKWKGTGSDKLPMLMMAHQDVVPVDERTKADWTHDAFAGEIVDGYVWGRGAIDMKGQLCAIMDGVEHLLETGFAPKRDVYIALGHDEESTGIHGSSRIVELLKQRNIRFDFVIDEGGVVMDGKMIGVNAKVAAIGICEKGYADVKLTAASKGGHASRPPKETAVGALAKAIARLEKHQMKPTLNDAVKHMFDVVGGYMKFPLNVIVANTWLFKPLLLKALIASPTSASMVRSTTAPTMLKGSPVSNVLAEQAEAVINFRISPDSSVQGILEHIRKTIKNDDIKIELLQTSEPSKVSRTECEAYQVIASTAADMFGDYVVTPYLMIAMTDSRWYKDIAEGVYLFQPFRSLSEDLDTVHAVDERLEIASLQEGAAFFARLVKNADG